MATGKDKLTVKLTDAEFKAGEEALADVTTPASSPRGASLTYAVVAYAAKQLAAIILKKVPAGKARDTAINALKIVVAMCELAINKDEGAVEEGFE